MLSGRELTEEEVVGPTPARRVSWRPGAEGAPTVFAWRWEWVVEWEEGGAMRIAILTYFCSIFLCVVR